jgi:lupus La protein
VPIDLICSFKRMRHFQPRTAVIAALKESTILDLVDDDTALQRKVPVPADLGNKSQFEIVKIHEDAAMSRSVYVKGFGAEEPSTQFDLEAWFSKFGSTNSVRLRRSEDKSFKGSVFVEFDSEATAKAFLEVDPKPTYNGKELLIKSKKAYCDDKVADIEAGKIKPKGPRQREDRYKERGNRRGSPSYGDDRIDRDDWKARKEADQKSGFRDDRERRSGRGRGSRGGKGGNERFRDRNAER